MVPTPVATKSVPNLRASSFKSQPVKTLTRSTQPALHIYRKPIGKSEMGENLSRKKAYGGVKSLVAGFRVKTKVRIGSGGNESVLSEKKV